MKYLVTGGAGFIGSAVALRLVADGHEVVVLDNFNDYYDLELKEARVARFQGDVLVHRGDLTDVQALANLFAEHNFDAVCHLAAQAGVRYSLEHPETYIASNYTGTFNLLEAMRVAGVKKLVFASTSSVYGEDGNVPFDEGRSADRPVSVYAATKRAGEILAYSYHHLHQFDVACMRFFTVYGPWGRPDMAPFLFTKAILDEQPITVFNEGNMRRDFTYIDDIVDGFSKALDVTHGYEIYNLGNGRPVELLDFIRTVEQVTGKTAELVMAPMQAGDVTQTYADISKAQKNIGYNPSTNLLEGITQYVAWYQNYYLKK